MTKKTTISPVQLMLMSIGSALVFPYTFMPILTAPPANQDVWIVLFMAAIYFCIINAPVLFLINKFRGFSVNEIVETVLGKFFGKIATIILFLFFVYCFVACMLLTAIFINLYIFSETPIWALLLYMIVPITYAVYKGAGVIARLAFFIVPFIILTIIVFFLLGLGDMDLGELLPVLSDSSFLELNTGAFLTGARYSEILIFLVFSIWVNKKYSINKTFAVSISLFTVCFFLILIPTLTVLGVELGKNMWDPYFTYARQVRGYDFIERVHSLNTLAWFPAALLKLMLYNFMASYTLSGITKAKSHKRFVFLISAVGFGLCLLPILNKVSIVDMLRSDSVFPYTVLPVTLVIPLIIIIVYFIRRKKIQEILTKKKMTEGA